MKHLFTKAIISLTLVLMASSVWAQEVEVTFMSGNAVVGQLITLESNYIVYAQNGKEYTVPASQIEKVTFLENGQIKEYHGKSTTVEKTTSVVTASTQTNGRIYRDNGHYLCNDVYISSKEVEKRIMRDEAAAKEWKKGDRIVIAGGVFSGLGCGLVIGGLFFLLSPNNTGAVIGLECAGAVCGGIGIGLSLGGKAHYDKAIDIYNSKYDRTAVQFKWQLNANGIGLAMNF